MEENKGVNPPESPTGEPKPEPVREDDKTPEQPPKPEGELKVEEKTIPYLRFKDVIDEKNRLEARIKELESLPSSEEVLSQRYPDWDLLDDNQKVILKRQEVLEKELADIKAEKAKSEALTKAISDFPELKESETEFKDYCENYPQYDISVLAKSFLHDKKPSRAGLESPTGGDKSSIPFGLTVEEVKRIRETDEKLFAKLVREGRIDVKKLR